MFSGSTKNISSGEMFFGQNPRVLMERRVWSLLLAVLVLIFQQSKIIWNKNVSLQANIVRFGTNWNGVGFILCTKVQIFLRPGNAFPRQKSHHLRIWWVRLQQESLVRFQEHVWLFHARWIWKLFGTMIFDCQIEVWILRGDHYKLDLNSAPY